MANNKNMRKMFSEEQIIELVKQDNHEYERFGLIDGEDYGLVADTSENYVRIQEQESDNLKVIRELVGKMIYAYINDTLVIKGLIVACDSNPYALTMIPSDDWGNITDWKIFDK